MFSRRFLPALLLAALLSPLAPAADAPNPKVVAEMTRYLRAIHFGDIFQAGVRKTNTTRGQGSAFLDRLLAVTPQELEATVAPAFAAHVSLRDARAMADFFSGPLGQKVIEQGQRNIGVPNASPDLSADEAAALEKFGQTSAGKLAVALTTDPAIRQQYFVLLNARYGKP